MDCELQQGKDSDSSGSRKTFIILIFTFSVDTCGFCVVVFFSFFPSSVVVVGFIGTKKSN